LREARERFPSNNAFGVWLAQEEIDVSHDDRAAFIEMAAEPDVLRDVLIEQTDTFRAKTILRKHTDRFRLQSKTTVKGLQSFKTDATVSTAPIEPVSAPPQSDLKPESPLPAPRHKLVGSGNDVLRNPAKTELVKMLGITTEQYSAVMSAYPHNRQRKLKSELAKLSKKSARALFERAFEIARSGRAPVLSNSDTIDARIVLPDVPEGFCKTFTLQQLAQRLDHLELLNSKAAELKAAGLSAFDIHTELHHIWETGAARPPQAVKSIELAPDDSKNRIKHQVKYCGDVIWPNESLKHVSYQDLNMGWHIADHWLKRLEVATPLKPNELLVEIMHLIQDLRAASSLAGVTDSMMMCVQAYAKRNQRRDKADLSDGMPPGRPR
jgi:hypothetical protein